MIKEKENTSKRERKGVITWHKMWNRRRKIRDPWKTSRERRDREPRPGYICGLLFHERLSLRRHLLNLHCPFLFFISKHISCRSNSFYSDPKMKWPTSKRYKLENQPSNCSTKRSLIIFVFYFNIKKSKYVYIISKYINGDWRPFFPPFLYIIIKPDETTLNSSEEETSKKANL